MGSTRRHDPCTSAICRSVGVSGRPSVSVVSYMVVLLSAPHGERMAFDPRAYERTEQCSLPRRDGVTDGGTPGREPPPIAGSGGGDAVLAAELDAVHRAVGGAEEGFGVGGVVREGGDADARREGGDVRVHAVRRGAGSDRGTDALGDLEGGGRRRVREDDDELVAAESDAGVAGAEHFRDEPADRRD